MADQSDVRRIALSFPGVLESKDRFAFTVENNGKPHYNGFPGGAGAAAEGHASLAAQAAR